jgi:hypothetical protein
MHEFDRNTATANLHTIPALQEVDIREGVRVRPLVLSDASPLLAVLEKDPSMHTSKQTKDLFAIHC